MKPQLSLVAWPHCNFFACIWQWNPPESYGFFVRQVTGKRHGSMPVLCYTGIAMNSTPATDIDALINTAVFSTDEAQKKESNTAIHVLAKNNGAIPSSINNLYHAFGKDEIKNFTVPAFNIRALTYDTARVIFRLAKKMNAGAFIFEIARSEMGYTKQRPAEYSACILAAAIKEDYKGPVFIQGDHFQVNKEKFDTNPDEEIGALRDLIAESLEAKFYNIDIDASTVVDLSQSDLALQQKDNFTTTATLTKFIREHQPQGVTVSVGGEIGHIGGKNSTVADFEAFMTGYLSLTGGAQGISKVSVQTGTSHGGIPMADGTIADVQLNFSVLSDIGNVAREKYGLGGAVQHGASTLPNSLFGEFVKSKTLEIHLATGFQNIVFDNLPDDLRGEMMQWVQKNMGDDRDNAMSEQQFMYKTRKKALGPFKKQLWELGTTEKGPILNALEKQFAFLFQKLNITNTKPVVDKYA
jgi:fructose/tagatose bisphosphate aldolase